MSLLKTMDDFHWPLHLIARQTVEVGGIRCNGGGGGEEMMMMLMTMMMIIGHV